ncbi:MAG TPA: EAL domain-containing protein [Firmicutes bacterium]|nr:EAL domain-containing protein [Bacillota bacterium]
MSVRILVVDDSGTDREIVRSMLLGYDLLVACDGVEALQVIDENPDIGLVVLDLHMPRMDGFEVLEVFRSDRRYQGLRTIILTNLDELDNEMQGLQLGAVDFVRKPIHMASLKARIDVHLELVRIQRALERRLDVQGMTLEAIFRHMPAGIAISWNKGPMTAEANTYFTTNPAFQRLIGRTKEELIMAGWAGIIHPDDLQEASRNFERLQAGETSGFAMDTRLLRPDGAVLWAHVCVSSLALWENPEFNHMAFVEDITARKVMEKNLTESERSKSVLLANLPGLAYRCDYDSDWTMKFVSTGCWALTGYAPEDLVNNSRISFNDIISPEYRPLLREEWAHAVAKGAPFRYEYEITTASGERKWVLEMGQASYNDAGGVEALEGIILDISDRKEMENNLRYINTHDSSTGLHNREYLETLLESDARKRQPLKRALVGINLDLVRLVEANYGFHYAEELIRKAADKLSQYCTEGCQLFRPYESRLVFYLVNYAGQKELIDFSERIAEDLDHLFATERVGGGIGILEISSEGEQDADLLLKKLLIASERSISIFDKDFRRRFYDRDLEALVNREGDIIQELSRLAADGDREGLFLEYQPIVDLRTNSIHGFEALARLCTESLGLVSPLEFIPLAEKTKLIIPIGEQVIVKAFRFLKRLKKQGYDTVHVTVNISAIQLLRPGFTERLLELSRVMDIDPHVVGIEITESVFASNYDYVNKVIAQLRDAGCYVAIDDFGTGYSSMRRMRELNANCLKIDKYFIDSLFEVGRDAAITRDIISIAHRLGYFVVAEGVTSVEQEQYLVANQCDMIQGYRISRPLPEDVALEFLQRYDDSASILEQA